jgi:hypothetical protein
LSTTNLAYCPDVNLGHCGEKPVMNHLSYDTAYNKIALITGHAISEAFTGFSPWISQYNPMVAHM